MRVLLLGATGTIGWATARALALRGHQVICLARPASASRLRQRLDAADSPLRGAEIRLGDPTDPDFSAAQAFGDPGPQAVVSCMASRTGAPADAWAVDHRAHTRLLTAARGAGVGHFVLLSAICVQKPLLAFQQAKLAFEGELTASGIDHSIVRPTAFFKSLSGQLQRLRQGKAFLIFGDGTLTACKPISDDDLAAYLADCLTDPLRRNQVLPIGGPGPAITPREQGEKLFELLKRKPKFQSVPIGLMDGIIATLALGGRVSRKLADKAEFARIGRYYATESMLVLDPVGGRYSAEATPSTGSETLFEFYRKLVRGEASVNLGEHAVF